MGLFETATAATMCRSKMSPLTYYTPPAIEVAKTKIAAMDQFRSFQIQDSMDGLGSNLLTWSISSLSSPIFFRIPAMRIICRRGLLVHGENVVLPSSKSTLHKGHSCTSQRRLSSYEPEGSSGLSGTIYS